VSPKRFKASIKAGGGVVHRAGDKKGEYLLVHRPRYDDWTLPKGKLNRREGYLEAALREVREESGVRGSRPVNVGSIGYATDQGNRKVVRWWLMEEAEEARFRRNNEVDEIAWLTKGKALKRLDYEADRNVLARAHDLVDDPTRSTIYLTRHGRAGDPAQWRGKDRKRPLDKKGRKQSLRLAAGLDGHPITRLLASPTQRCVQMIRPLSFSIRLPIHTDKRLRADAKSGDLLTMIGELQGESAVLASHGELIGSVIAGLAADGVDLDGPEEWAKGSIWVLEASNGKVVSGRYVEAV
jgi:phosphohistidine phosphatase SixA/ADP-ribose pyrophosphatase YjhB (NUDIX family)